MAEVTASVTPDENLTARARELFAGLGLALPTAINIFPRQSIRESGIPFNVQRDTPNADDEAADGADELLPLSRTAPTAVSFSHARPAL